MAVVCRWPEFAQRLKSARALAGLTAEECATRLGEKVGTLRCWERGTSMPSDPNRLYEIASALGVLPAWLGRGVGARTVREIGRKPQIPVSGKRKPSLLDCWRAWSQRLKQKLRSSGHKEVKLFVAYRRVSDPIQEREGLGLLAQLLSLRRYIRGRGKIAAIFTEVKSGKLTIRSRPELGKALELSHTLTATLVVAKLDRLARNVAFIAALMERKVDFLSVDMPYANRLTLHVMAALAEYESERTSLRVKAVFAVMKARGQRLGIQRLSREKREQAWRKSAEIMRSKTGAFIERVSPILRSLRANGITSRREIARILNENEVPTFMNRRWHQTLVASIEMQMRPPVLSANAHAIRARRRAEEILSVVVKIAESGSTTLRAICLKLESQGILSPKGHSWRPGGLHTVINKTGVTIREIVEDIERKRRRSKPEAYRSVKSKKEVVCPKARALEKKVVRFPIPAEFQAQISTRDFVAYLRVSRRSQAEPRDSIEGQRLSIQSFVGSKGNIIREYVETKSAFKKSSSRQELAKAIADCREEGAALVIAHLDRLARNLYFVTQLMESGIEFVAVDAPIASRLTIHFMVAYAEYESRQTAERIRAGKALARATGRESRSGFQYWPAKKLRRHIRQTALLNRQRADEFARSVHPIIDRLREEGFHNYKLLTAGLALNKVMTPRNKKWSEAEVMALDRRCRESVQTRRPLQTIHFLARDRRYAREIRKIQAAGAHTGVEIVRALNAKGIRRPRGGMWSEPGLTHVLGRISAREIVFVTKGIKCTYVVPPL